MSAGAGKKEGRESFLKQQVGKSLSADWMRPVAQEKG